VKLRGLGCVLCVFCVISRVFHVKRVCTVLPGANINPFPFKKRCARSVTQGELSKEKPARNEEKTRVYTWRQMKRDWKNKN
jgi:hypothetical protein